MAYIKALTQYLPERILTNEDLYKELGDDKLIQLSIAAGIRERHIAAEDETAGDMACKAAERLFLENGIDRNDIDFLIFCTQCPDYLVPSTSCILQDKLRLSLKTGTVSIDHGCSGFIYGLVLADSLVKSGAATNVLLLTGDTVGKHLWSPNDKNKLLFGDAASAALVSNEGIAKIGKFSLGTDGSNFDKLIVRNGGARHKQLENNENDYSYMNGEAIFSFTLERVPKLVKDILGKMVYQKRILTYIVSISQINCC